MTDNRIFFPSASANYWENIKRIEKGQYCPSSPVYCWGEHLYLWSSIYSILTPMVFTAMVRSPCPPKFYHHHHLVLAGVEQEAVLLWRQATKSFISHLYSHSSPFQMHPLSTQWLSLENFSMWNFFLVLRLQWIADYPKRTGGICIYICFKHILYIVYNIKHNFRRSFGTFLINKYLTFLVKNEFCFLPGASSVLLALPAPLYVASNISAGSDPVQWYPRTLQQIQLFWYLIIFRLLGVCLVVALVFMVVAGVLPGGYLALSRLIIEQRIQHAPLSHPRHNRLMSVVLWMLSASRSQRPQRPKRVCFLDYHIEKLETNNKESRHKNKGKNTSHNFNWQLIKLNHLQIQATSPGTTRSPGSQLQAAMQSGQHWWPAKPKRLLQGTARPRWALSLQEFINPNFI